MHHLGDELDGLALARGRAAPSGRASRRSPPSPRPCTVDHLAVEQRLRHAPVTQPVLAVGRQQALAEEELEVLVELPARVVLVVALEHVAHALGMRQACTRYGPSRLRTTSPYSRWPSMSISIGSFRNAARLPITRFPRGPGATRRAEGRGCGDVRSCLRRAPSPPSPRRSRAPLLARDVLAGLVVHVAEDDPTTSFIWMIIRPSGRTATNRLARWDPRASSLGVT